MADSTKGIDFEEMQRIARRPRGHTHLLVIAIDAYEHCPRLSNCVKDAKDFIRLMQERYRVTADRTYEVFNANATRTRVLRQLKQLRHKVGEDDNLLVYFSGHDEVEDEEGLLVPVGAWG